MLKELQEEGGNSGSDAYKEVDDYKEHIGCAGNLKPEGCWVHNGSDGPSEGHQKSRRRPHIRQCLESRAR